MANPNQVVGRLKIKIDGAMQPTAQGKATMNIGGVTREAVPGDYESGSFMEKQVPSETDFEVLLKKGVSLANLRAIDNATLTLETDIGTSYIVRNAYCADAITVGQEGSAKVKFMGPPAEEVL